MRTTLLSLWVVFVVSTLIAANHGNAPQPTSGPAAIAAGPPQVLAVTGATSAPVTVAAPQPIANAEAPMSSEGPRLITPAAASLSDAMPASPPVAAPRP